jgi:hypothetical protein
MPKSRVRPKTKQRRSQAAQRENAIRRQINATKRYIAHGVAMRATNGQPAIGVLTANNSVRVRTLDNVAADPRDQQFVRVRDHSAHAQTKATPSDFTITRIPDDAPETPTIVTDLTPEQIRDDVSRTPRPADLVTEAATEAA